MYNQETHAPIIGLPHDVIDKTVIARPESSK